MENTERQEKEKRKTYTQKREEVLFAWKKVCDEDENSWSNVLGVLLHEFRSFGEGLAAIMEAKLGFKVTFPEIDLECACQRTGIH